MTPDPAHVDVASLRAGHVIQETHILGRICAKDAQDWPCATMRLLDEVENLRAKVAAVEALADEWDSSEWCDSDVTYGSAARELRAALESKP